MFLKLNTNYGMLIHYYHFFYGVLVPLILLHLDTGVSCFYVDNCVSPMSNILHSLPFYINYFTKNKVIPTRGIVPKTVKKIHNLIPMDSSKSAMIKNHRALITPSDKLKICNFFEEHVPEYLRQLKYKKIVLISRKTENLFDQLEIDKIGAHPMIAVLGTTSGSNRRSIDNLIEVDNFLTDTYGDDYVQISTERTDIYYQYMVFKHANVVIAMHGAALSNIIFMKEGSKVIEIIPESKIREGEDTFINLGKIFKLNYKTYVTDSNHPTINNGKLNELITKK
jgi:hypothetical protein